MADEKKPGLLKRIFSFGFGKKKNAEAEEAAAAEEAAHLEAERAAEEEAIRIAAEERRKAEEELARAEAEAKAKEEERLAQLEAERQAKEEAARKEAEEARLEEEARQKAEAERLEAERIAAEEKARKVAEEAERLEAEAKAEAEKEAAEQAEKQAAEEKAKVEAQKRAQEERLEAERIAAEKAEAEKAEAERLEAERIAAEEEATRKAAEETERLAAEAKAEAERKAAEQAEKEAADEKARVEAEKRAQEERLEAERIAAEKAEAEKAEAERIAAEEEARKAAEMEAARLASEEEAARIEPEPEPDEYEEDEERKEGWFKRLRKGLSRSSSNLKENITSVFTKKKLDEDTLQDLEDILIQADLGIETAMNVTDALASQRMGKDVTDEEVRQIMAEEVAKTLEPVALPLELDLDHQPHVILVVGVNGSGKTTTIGKISQKLYNAGFSTLLVAGDTFRAAAVEQLHIWGERTQAPVMSRPNGADAAGLAFDAYSEAQAQKKDVMLMDTAGRLQNRKELMDELEKIIRVLKKQDPSAPHTVLLTLDATTGQNALNQVEIFKDVAGVNGLVMTKLDGTARGGILVAISAKHKLPVYFIGVGEQVEDLEPFEADVFAKAIAGLETE